MNNWPRKKLGEVCEVFTDGDWIETKDQSFTGIRLIQTGNIGQGIFLDKPGKSRFITEKTFNRLNCKEVFPDDLLISRLPEPVGRSCVVPDLESKMITSVDCTIVRPHKQKILRDYLLYFTNSRDYYSQIEKNLSGTTRQRISRGNLSNIEIPLPPLSEQKKIVAKLEKLLGKIKEAKRLRAESQEAVQNLLSAELHKIFGGNDENLQKQKIKDLSILVNGRVFKKSEWRSSGNSTLPIIRIQNLNDKTKDFNYYAGDYDEKILVNPEDLLFSWSGSRGTSFGPHIWHGNKGLLNQHIFKVNYDQNKINKRYFYYSMKYLVDEVERNLHGGVGLVHITKTKFENFPVQTPSLSQQKMIVARLDKLSENIQKLQAYQDSTATDLASLEQSILHQAFEGKL